MAILAIRGNMRAYQGEAALLVQLGDIGYHPGVWSMASCTFLADCLLMNISMAAVAFALRFCKFKRSVTQFTGNSLVLANKRKPGAIMIEGHGL